MNGRNTFSPPDRIALLLLIALILTAFVYWSGLHGLWLLDDHQNLKFLEESATPELSSPLARFITSGTAGPLGRPVSLLSFAIPHADWPRDPGGVRAFSTIAGLLAYVHGRKHLAEGKTRRGIAWMSAGIAAGGALAVLSKEEGALLVVCSLL